MYVARVPYGWCAALAVGLLWVTSLAVAYAWLQPVVVGEWAISFLLAVNLVTLICFCYDKAIAGRPIYRIPESVLLWLMFLGGSPAASLAQPLLRHKVKKRKFRLPYFVILFAHVAIGLYCYELGAKLPWSMEVPMPFATWLQGL